MEEPIVQGIKTTYKPTARIDVDVDNSMLSDMEVDKVVTVTIKGKVKAVRAADEFGPGSLELEVMSLAGDEVNEFDSVMTEDD
jgi:hypothetical protein